MTTPGISAVVVSRERPESLSRTLTALGQQTCRNMEILVVADSSGAAAVRSHRLGRHVRLIVNDAPGVARARNLGIADTAGEIVAFIDDDAVPEPTWAENLSRPFADPYVAAATGYVRGRNGISLQWAGRGVTATADHLLLENGAGDWILPTLPEGVAVKLEGTNMAVRRTWFETFGGFDEAYSFYLDDTDLSLRLRATGAAVAIVPVAEVHHAFEPSPRRGKDRRPLDLREIGTSLAYFLKKHADGNRQRALLRHVAAERERALRNMVSGGLEPRDVGQLMQSLSQGLATTPENYGVPRISPRGRNLQPVPIAQSEPMSQIISGPRRNLQNLRDMAAKSVADGQRVSLFCLSRSLTFHQVRFSPDGYWEHTGGIFGKSARTQATFRRSTFSARLAEESERVRVVRGLGC